MNVVLLTFNTSTLTVEGQDLACTYVPLMVFLALGGLGGVGAPGPGGVGGAGGVGNAIRLTANSRFKNLMLVPDPFPALLRGEGSLGSWRLPPFDGGY